MIGAVVGAMGGLFAVGIPWAIIKGDIKALSDARSFGVIGLVVSAPVGWFIGGQIGPRLENILSERNAGIVGGVIGGLVPVTGFILWGWFLVAR